MDAMTKATTRLAIESIVSGEWDPFLDRIADAVDARRSELEANGEQPS